MVHIEKIREGGITTNLEALQTMKRPESPKFPQFTYSELSKGKPVPLDNKSRNERVAAGI